MTKPGCRFYRCATIGMEEVEVEVIHLFSLLRGIKAIPKRARSIRRPDLDSQSELEDTPRDRFP